MSLDAEIMKRHEEKKRKILYSEDALLSGKIILLVGLIFSYQIDIVIQADSWYISDSL
jgi:hypothetical protein